MEATRPCGCMIYAAIEPSGTYPRDVRPIGQTELAIQLKLSRFAQTDSFVNLANLPTVAAPIQRPPARSAGADRAFGASHQIFEADIEWRIILPPHIIVMPPLKDERNEAVLLHGRLQFEAIVPLLFGPFG